MSSNIQVFVRCRPLVKSEIKVPVPVEVYPELHKIIVRDTGTDKSSVKTFTYDSVFGPEVSQAEIYSKIVAPLVGEVIQGFNCTIFAYGQTGTGKTFTIEGGRSVNLSDRSEDPLSGIIPRSMKHLFNELRSQNLKSDICVSFLELYNEEIYDLLSKYDDFIKLRMYENSSQKGSVIVSGLEVVTVKNMDEVYAILEKGCKKRRKAVTLLNKASSRSHTIFTVTVSSKESSTMLQKVKSGKLNLVDLAGSENIGRSGAINNRAREAGNINQSLLALGRVITSLCEKAGHIPYRESKLTRLLQDSLGGQTKTAVIATISPSSMHIDETLNTLEYALRAKSITNRPELNAQLTVNSIVQDYLEKINTLRKAIYEAGKKNGVCVSEENLKSWESLFSAKQDEKFNLLTQEKSISQEEKSLECTIVELKRTLEEKENQFENARMEKEDYKQQLINTKEEHKLHDEIFNIMQPMHDCIHEKYHKILEEIKKSELESTKWKEIVEGVLKEQIKVHETLAEIRSKHKLWHEKVRQDSETILSDITNMCDSVNSLTTDSKNRIYMLKNGFDDRKSNCERTFQNVSTAVNELEIISIDFEENIEVFLLEEKTVKLKSIEDFEKEYLLSSKNSTFESLNQIINFCESSLLQLSSAASEWKKEAVVKMENREKWMKEQKGNLKDILESAAENIKSLLNSQKESIDEFNIIVSESLTTGSTRKMVVLDKFRVVEQAISSLDTYCTDANLNEVDKTNQVHSIMKKYLGLGNEIVEKLSICGENSAKSIDDMYKNAETHVPGIFSVKWKDLKKVQDSAFVRYKNLTEELQSLSKTNQGFNEICDTVKRLLKDIDESQEQLKVLKSVRMMADTVMKRGNSFISHIVKNYTQVESSLSEDKLNVDSLVESSKQLAKITDSKLLDYHKFLKNDLLKRFERKYSEEIAARIEGSFNETDTVVSERTLCVPNTASDLPQQSSLHEIECPICVKNMNETFKTDDNVSVIYKGNFKDKNEIPGSSRSFTAFPNSPIRRPRSKNSMVIRKNLQFPDAEKLAQELLENYNEEEST